MTHARALNAGHFAVGVTDIAAPHALATWRASCVVRSCDIGARRARPLQLGVELAASTLSTVRLELARGAQAPADGRAVVTSSGEVKIADGLARDVPRGPGCVNLAASGWRSPTSARPCIGAAPDLVVFLY